MLEYGLEKYFEGLSGRLAEITPSVLGAIVVLIVGWALGRAVGHGLSRVLDKAGVDSAVRRTIIGRAMTRSGMTVVKFFDYMIRWFIYLIAVLAAVNILNLPALSNFINSVVQYLPSFIAGVFIILFGIIIADFVGDAVKALGKEAKIEFASVLGDALKLIMYSVVVIIGLSMMKIDVEILYIFANAIAWGVALGVGGAIAIAFGLGFKDYVARNADRWASSFTSKSMKKP